MKKIRKAVSTKKQSNTGRQLEQPTGTLVVFRAFSAPQVRWRPTTRAGRRLCGTVLVMAAVHAPALHNCAPSNSSATLFFSFLFFVFFLWVALDSAAGQCRQQLVHGVLAAPACATHCTRTQAAAAASWPPPSPPPPQVVLLVPLRVRRERTLTGARGLAALGWARRRRHGAAGQQAAALDARSQLLLVVVVGACGGAGLPTGPSNVDRVQMTRIWPRHGKEEREDKKMKGRRGERPAMVRLGNDRLSARFLVCALLVCLFVCGLFLLCILAWCRSPTGSLNERTTTTRRGRR